MEFHTARALLCSPPVAQPCAQGLALNGRLRFHICFFSSAGDSALRSSMPGPPGAVLFRDVRLSLVLLPTSLASLFCWHSCNSWHSCVFALFYRRMPTISRMPRTSTISIMPRMPMVTVHDVTILPSIPMEYDAKEETFSSRRPF